MFFTMAPLPVIAVRLGLVLVGIVLWFWSQAALAKRVPKVAYEVPLTDGIHGLTARLHRRYATNQAAGNRLLIISSLVIDLLGAYLLATAICGQSMRPFVGLALLFTLRQICQVLCPLPAPAGMVWRYPGVPALLVTYGTANDLFFSGHTAIAVLILRAHYTMDVFTGIICALWVYSLSGALAPWLDSLIGQWVG